MPMFMYVHIYIYKHKTAHEIVDCSEKGRVPGKVWERELTLTVSPFVLYLFFFLIDITYLMNSKNDDNKRNHFAFSLTYVK